MTASDQLPAATTTPSDPPAAKADAHPMEIQAIRRAAEIGIDPYRVALAMGIPAEAVPGLLADADPSA